MDSVSPVQSFFKFSAKPELGRFVLDSRPVWLFSSDGNKLVWANSPGLECFELASLLDVVRLNFDNTTPARRHIVKIATQPAEQSRGKVEILRFLIGTKTQSHACVCRPVHFDGQIYVLAVASDLTQRKSFSERTQSLLDVILKTDNKAIGALKDSSGHILAVTQKAPPQGMASVALSALSEAISKEGEHYIESLFNLNGQTLGLAIEFSFDNRIYQLIILTVYNLRQEQDDPNAFGSGETNSALLSSTVSGQAGSAQHQAYEHDNLQALGGVPQASQRQVDPYGASEMQPQSAPAPSYQAPQSPPIPPAPQMHDPAYRQPVAIEPGQPIAQSPAVPKNNPLPVMPSTPNYNPEPIAPVGTPPATQPNPFASSGDQAPKKASPSDMSARLKERFEKSREKLQGSQPQNSQTMPQQNTAPTSPPAQTPQQEEPVDPAQSKRQKLFDKIRANKKPQSDALSKTSETTPSETIVSQQETYGQKPLAQPSQNQSAPPPRNTQSQPASQRLEQSGSKMQSSPAPFEGIKRFAWQTNVDYQLIRLSDEFETLTGLDVEEWQRQTFSSLGDILQSPELQAVDDAVRSQQRFSDLGARFQKDGQAYQITFSGIPIQDPKSGQVSFRGFGKIETVRNFEQNQTENRPAPKPKPESSVEDDDDLNPYHDPTSTAALDDFDITRDETRASFDAYQEDETRDTLQPAPKAPQSDQTESAAPSKSSLSSDEQSNFKAIADRLKDAQSQNNALNVQPSQPQNEGTAPEAQTPQDEKPETILQKKQDPEPEKTEDKDNKAAQSKTAKVETEAPDFSLLDPIALAIFVQNDEGCVFANMMAQNMAGVPLKKIKELHGIHHFSQTELQNPMTATKFIRPDGQMINVIVRKQNIVFGGQPYQMFTVKEREEVLGKARSRSTEADASNRTSDMLDHLFEVLNNGVVMFDATGKITRVNSAVQHMFEHTSDELSGKPLTVLFSADSHDEIEDQRQALMSSSSVNTSQAVHWLEGLSAKGNPLAVGVQFKLLDGEPEHYCLEVQDMRSWKKLETDLLAAKKQAEDASAHKSEFLARISHEIRTPLNAIIGFSEVMKEERFGALQSSRYREYVKDIHTSGEHVVSLLNDLLDLSKIEAGKMELSFDSVSANDVIEQCVSIIQAQAKQKKILIRNTLSQDLPNIVADKRSLRQIMLNLLSNAVKFTPSGGHVIISTSYESNGEVSIKVRDTGIGMSEKDKETAMEPFRQIEALPKTQNLQEGTGLGLPLTKALVEANRASFEIESEEDKGTLVRIHFPPQRVLTDQ